MFRGFREFREFREVRVFGGFWGLGFRVLRFCAKITEARDVLVLISSEFRPSSFHLNR